MGTLLHSRLLRTLVLVTTTALTTGACYSWSTVEQPGELATVRDTVGRAMVTDRLGNEWDVQDLHFTDGVFHGKRSASGTPFSMPAERVETVKLRRLDEKRSLVVAIPFLAIGAAAVAYAAYKDPPCWPFCEWENE